MFLREIELDSGGLVVRVDQQETGDVGCVVWDAALVLVKYLDRRNQLEPDFLRNQPVLELGAGTGALGITAALLGANSVLTDLSNFIPLIDHNIELNKEFCISTVATSLHWGVKTEISSVKKSGPFSYILVADCVYYEESVAALVSTLEQLTSPSTTVLLSYEDRDSPAKIKIKNDFFQLMSKKFCYSEIPLSEHHPDFASPDIHIVSLCLRQ